MVNKTIDYYNRHASDFQRCTESVDMGAHYNRFEVHLRPGARILDAGCGVGRDTKYFIEKGYDVIAFDASLEMVRMSTELTGIDVLLTTFEDFHSEQLFDGIWACASLLHLERNILLVVLESLVSMLLAKGVFYMSFKYGDKTYTKDDRYFNCYDEKAFKELVARIDGLEIVDLYQSSDVRKDRTNEYWLNAIVRKK